MSLTDEILGIFSALGSIAAIFTIFLPLLDSTHSTKPTRRAVLGLLSLAYPEFHKFSEMFVEPSRFLGGENRRSKFYLLLVMLPAVLGAGFVGIAMMSISISFTTLLYLVLPASLGVLTITVVLQNLIPAQTRREKNSVKPPQSILFCLAISNSMPGYLRILMAIFLVIFIKSIPQYAVFFAGINNTELVISSVILGGYAIMMIICIDYTNIVSKATTQLVQNQFYVRYFPRSRMLIEVTVQNPNSQVLEKIVGLLMDIGYGLKIFREDRYVQLIEWRKIVAIAARENTMGLKLE